MFQYEGIDVPALRLVRDKVADDFSKLYAVVIHFVDKLSRDVFSGEANDKVRALGPY